MRDSFSYDPRNPRADLEGKGLEDKVLDTFLEMTGGPLSANPPVEEGGRLQLYRGVTWGEREEFNGMFSFFPAKPADNNSSFRQPFPFSERDEQFYIQYFNPCLNQGVKGIGRHIPERSPEKLRKLWDLIVKQVRNDGQNLVLGIHADLPPEHPAE